MAKPKPPLLPLHRIEPGQVADCFAILSDKTLTTTRDGKTFVNCKFKDRQRTVNVAVWSDSVLFDEAKDWPVGQFFKLRGTFSEHERYGPKFDLANVRPVTDDDRKDGFRESDLIDYTPELKTEALRVLNMYKYGEGPFTPPSTRGDRPVARPIFCRPAR